MPVKLLASTLDKVPATDTAEGFAPTLLSRTTTAAIERTAAMAHQLIWYMYHAVAECALTGVAAIALVAVCPTGPQNRCVAAVWTRGRVVDARALRQPDAVLPEFGEGPGDLWWSCPPLAAPLLDAELLRCFCGLAAHAFSVSFECGIPHLEDVVHHTYATTA